MSALWPGKAKLVATLKEAVAAFKEAGGRLDFIPGVKGGQPSNRWAKTPTIPPDLRENNANEGKGAAEISNSSAKISGKNANREGGISTVSPSKQRKQGKVSARRRPPAA